MAVAGRSTMPARAAGGLQRAGSRVAGRRRRDHPRHVGRDGDNGYDVSGHDGPTAGRRAVPGPVGPAAVWCLVGVSPRPHPLTVGGGERVRDGHAAAAGA